MGYNSDTHTITVGPNSDFIADSGVHFIHTYREMAQKPTAPDAIRSDWKTLEDWLGCTGRSLNADDDNRIRVAWLGYYAVGVAPSLELQSVFDTFATTHNVKELIKGKPPTPIMDVFDRMQATDDAIAEKRAHDIAVEKRKFTAALSGVPKRTTTPTPTATAATPPPPQFPSWMREPERLRRVLFVTLGLLWWIWLDHEIHGFRYVEPAGWLIIFAVPTATWFGLPHILKWLRGAPRDTRLVFSANVMWIMLVAMWGYIWRWDNELSSERYLALFVLPSIAAWIGLFLWRWSKSDQR